MEGDERPSVSLEPETPWAYRGRDLSRILALSDGIFAFAMTLLVLGLALPLGAHGAQVRNYLFSSAFIGPLYAYVITFFVISLWWQGHHLVYTYLRGYDRNLIRLNVAFLIFIAILPFSTDVLTASGTDAVGVTVFALLQLGAGVTLGGLWTYASGPGKLVAPKLPPQWKRYVTINTFAPAVLFALSIPVAFVNSNLAEVTWLLIVAVPLVMRARSRR